MIQLKSLLIKEMKIPSESDDIKLTKQHLTSVDTYRYEIISPYSYLNFSYDENTRVFSVNMIRTTKIEDRNKGYSKLILKYLFDLIKLNNGTLDTGDYTGPGQLYVKHVIERLAKHYNIKLITTNEND